MSTSVIGSLRKQFWQDNGFLVFPGFCSHEEVAAISEAYDRTWRDQPPWVVVDDLVTGRRCRIRDLGEDERRHHFKINDMYLTEPALRSVILSERLTMILEELLGDEPAVCNTLNFDKGSQQPEHLDTLYMTPPASERGLAATWMALEDTAADAGPLRYYPESNHIDPYRFSDGSMHVLEAEMPRWCDYMAEQVDRRGLQEERFLARKGDLFIWSALLLHGGSEIANPARTRQSLVTHYWTQTDCETKSWDLRPGPTGWWIFKPPLEVPGERRPVVEIHGQSDQNLIDFPAQGSASDVGGTDLRDRLETLQGASD
jgi:phytanoyl-CoA hydroxylase